jgi:hypothetical protein
VKKSNCIVIGSRGIIYHQRWLNSGFKPRRGRRGGKEGGRRKRERKEGGERGGGGKEGELGCEAEEDQRQRGQQ